MSDSLKNQIEKLPQGKFYRTQNGHIIEGVRLYLFYNYSTADYELNHLNGYLIESSTGKRIKEVFYNLDKHSVDSDLLLLPEKEQERLRGLVDSNLEKSVQTKSDAQRQPKCTEPLSKFKLSDENMLKS